MKKEAVYKILIFFLLALNIIQLGGRLFAPPHSAMPHFSPPPPDVNAESFRDKTPAILELDEQQTQEFIALASMHREQIHSLQAKQNELTSQYFNQPTTELMDAILALDAEKITATQAHFQEIYTLLNDEQKQNFQIFKQEALNIIMP